MLRIDKGNDLLRVSIFKEYVHNYFQKKRTKQTEVQARNYAISESDVIDNTNVNREILIVLIFKAVKLIIKTFISCYFVANIWFILV